MLFGLNQGSGFFFFPRPFFFFFPRFWRIASICAIMEPAGGGAGALAAPPLPGITGLDLSTVTVFFKLLPARIASSKLPPPPPWYYVIQSWHRAT